MNISLFSLVQTLSRVQLCDLMNRSTPGLPVRLLKVKRHRCVCTHILNAFLKVYFYWSISPTSEKIMFKLVPILLKVFLRCSEF